MSSPIKSETHFGRVMVLGSRGMVGSACIRELKKCLSVSEVISVCRDQVDLTDQAATFQCITSERPDWVVIAAAKVGGIHANNNYPADFIHQNLTIQNNVIEGCLRAGVEKLIFLGSSCIYPKNCSQPMREEALLSGPLEPTNEPYALAKIAGIKMCEAYNRQFFTDYRSLMPTNLYGPGDNYHDTNSHVIPGLLRRFHEAKRDQDSNVKVWGSGEVWREFLHVDDLAKAIIFVMSQTKQQFNSVVSENCSHVNVGSGHEMTIKELAFMIKSVVDVDIPIEFDKSKPDGAPRKFLDSSKLRGLGWSETIKLKDGLKQVYQDFVNSYS